ncbi:uncharacterized protein LOC119799370 isoform X1 [Cyprinodon tularosa]|uniref:uncharacterized protein LOC119799370 isoform X1 n=1 Tax=Cyprinodon tularosa TaxID=77115 RepID=UPI0018E289A4|nr:uncharacterized protein LOC119799370 isoform X1 [Cyprinodon tularosa]
MSQEILFIIMLLVHHTTQSQREVIKDCNEDVLLEGPVSRNKALDFFSFTWYKGEAAIIRMRKDKPQAFNFSREAKFGENLSLILPLVKPEDSGTYKYKIVANVGGQNEEGTVTLRVNECVTQTNPTTATATTTPNSTQSNLPLDVQEFPPHWSLAGYLLVAIAKILLSLTCIQMMHVISTRREKNRLYS